MVVNHNGQESDLKPSVSPLLGSHRDLDHPGKHCHSSHPLHYLLFLPRSLGARWGNGTPHLSKVVIPGLVPGTPDSICT